MKSNREQKGSFWEEHIQKWQESGLSQKVYCEAHGIKRTTFATYRSRLLNSNPLPKTAVNFVTVKPQLGNPQQPVAALQLMLPNGIRIGVSSEISESLLKMVLNAAGQVVC